ncbi:hypothetical protein [Natronorubrum halophilum]|uniref:hypothetical protein n=1 Tax=Natronorubrum halophilum TaxID=1702106 RepID=UPI0013CF1F20|nr:hypothetical protein [Natronorubrum halophilum]
MPSKCAECGMNTAPGRRVCKDCSMMDRHGTPSDHTSTQTDDGVYCWVQDIEETWHASMYFEGSSHAAACGELLETPVADVKDDPRHLDETHTCDACEQYLEADEAETTVPDGGEFATASELRADGGERIDDSGSSADHSSAGGLEEVFRRETIVATDDGIAIGADADPARFERERGESQ